MKARRVNRVASTLQASDHPYLNGAWAPIFEEWDADDLDVIGKIPADLDGVYLRNTENPVQRPLGRYHPFDGDGMLHSIAFRDGKASYRNRFIRTSGFIAEQQAGRALWSGIAEMPPRSERPGCGAQGFLKDASSTDVTVHAGRALTSFYQCGELYQLDPLTLEQLGPARWDGATPAWFPPEGVSAHSKVDEATGELLFFNYSRQAPYMHYGVVGADRKLKHYVPIPLPGPRLPHDMAFTPNYSILNDCPLFWDETLFERKIFAARMHDLPTRFAIIPRHGQSSKTRWFEASPTYVLHWTNAFESGDEIVLDGYRQLDPMPPPLPGAPRAYAHLMAYTDIHSMKPQLWRWRFNLKTGQTHEAALDERYCEFGMINAHYAGQPYRYVYSALGAHGMFLFTGLRKHDLVHGVSMDADFGEGIFGSEAPFAPRIGAESEDDGYLLSFVTDMNRDCSECWIFAAQDLQAGPVARVRLPLRIPSGTHSCWTTGEALRAAAS
ncbi:MAG: carotenoid oxygenase family protein [Stenotrophobium sp.]